MTTNILKSVVKGFWAVAMIISFTFAPSAHAQVQMSSNSSIADVLKSLFDKEADLLQSNQPEFVVDDTVIEQTAKIIAYFDRFPNDPKERVAKDWAFQFVYSAYQYEIGWSEVATLAQIESTGFANDCAELPAHKLTPAFMQSEEGQKLSGKEFVNGFGWAAFHYDPCNTQFNNYGEAIYHITWNFSGNREQTAQYYAGKTLDERLYSYNQVNTEYPKKYYGSKRKLESMTPTSAQIAEAKRQWASYTPVDTNNSTPAMRVVLASNQ